MNDADIDYYEARRQARALLGQHADVSKAKGITPFPARVGVWMGSKFILVGAGQSYVEALAEAKTRQKMLEEP